MVCSMTGFGRSEIIADDRRIQVEMKSVNNRYLDLSLKMPRMFNALESDIRNEIKKSIKRGKVDVFITYEDLSKRDTKITYNKEVAAGYMACLEQMATDFGLQNDVRISNLSKYPEVITMDTEDVDVKIIWEPLKKAIDDALLMFMNSRQREGEFLKEDLLKKLDIMKCDVDFIFEKSPEIVEEYKKNLRAKIADLMEDNNIDENRLAMEVTLFADKICVDEEIVRLKSHIEAVKKALDVGDDENGIGRKLDFLAQEMNREANTTLSKTSSIDISDKAIELKTTIEKVREQIQNIE